MAAGLATLLAVSVFAHVHAQLSTSTSLPPLQWINLTPSLSGSSPPPLKDAAIGYDETTRSIIIFGGESESGIPQSQTYLLNLNSLSWSQPSPPANLRSAPPARSAALSGTDFAANYRQGFVVVGGKGRDGSALSDVWEYDFNNQFWAEVSISPGGPSARWGASGGIDRRVATVQDPTLAVPNNTIYLAGGYDGSTVSSLSDVWRLRLSGTLSSNLPDSVTGSWDSANIGNLPQVVSPASTVVSQEIVTFGGCGDPSVTDDSCAIQDAFEIMTSNEQTQSMSTCPAPRKGAALVPNMNSASNSFSSQVFVMLGSFDRQRWNDSGALQNGGIDVLDIQTGSWNRVLPSGDPGGSGTETFPSPREGAAAVTYISGLVGSSRSSATDIIVFGGRDFNGSYLSEVWLLRAYSGTVSSSNSEWSGFGDGNLETGPNASGAGVRLTYLSDCAIAIQSGSSSTASSTPTQSSTPSATSTSSGESSSDLALFDIGIQHKVLSPVSLILLLPAVLLYRLSSPHVGSFQSDRSMTGIYLSSFAILIAYALGIAGLAFSFTSISSPASSSLAKRATTSSLVLQTAHGQAGLTLFVGLYGLVPVLALVFYLLRQKQSNSATSSETGSQKAIADKRERSASIETAEKLASTSRPVKSSSHTGHLSSRASSPRPRQRTQSWAGLFRRSEEHHSEEDSEEEQPPPRRTFEVIRPPRRVAENYLSVPHDGSARANLSQVDWLQRRRSLNAVGELDYAISQAMRSQPSPSTPATTALLGGQATRSHSTVPAIPHAYDIILHILFHAFLLALCILALVALFFRAPIATFVVFLVWTVAFYALLFTLAWFGRPANSLLTVAFARLRADHAQPQVPETSGPPSPSLGPTVGHRYPFPSTSPYMHQPPYRTAPYDALSMSHEGPRSLGSGDEDDEDDLDEETRQRNIEEEMARREVSIVTVPRRKLWITNPS